MREVAGLHHITAIAGPAQENLDFYAGVLGMRLVKRSVNQDDPGTYHLFYADAEGHPGTDLTFFPWAQIAPSRPGHGLAIEVRSQCRRAASAGGASGSSATARARRRRDALRRARAAAARSARPAAWRWSRAPTPRAAVHAVGRAARCRRAQQIRGLHGARMWERRAGATEAFLTDVLGFERVGAEGGWTRYGFQRRLGPACLDLCEMPTRGAARGASGSIHHLAWRVDDEAHQLARGRRW